MGVRIGMTHRPSAELDLPVEMGNAHVGRVDDRLTNPDRIEDERADAFAFP
jgi:hypothetical protein